jgi:3-methyladenine DNA glycosylase AlkD
MTTDTEVLAELESLGSAQTRKTYTRHGVNANQYGVSFAALGKLKKRLKTDHALALKLWASGNHDARVLATMIADPKQMDAATLESWVRDLDSYPITDAFSAFAWQTPNARETAERWIESDVEWIASAGWSLLGELARHDPTLPDSFFEALLERIERDLHGSMNRVRHNMNAAVIAIGVRNDALEARAVAAAEHIGKVVVDHGQTDCKTPAAIPYIQKVKARRQKA